MFTSFPPNYKNSIRFQIYERISNLFQIKFNFLINYGEPSPCFSRIIVTLLYPLKMIHEFIPPNAILVSSEEPKSTKPYQFYDFNQDGQEEMIITFKMALLNIHVDLLIIKGFPSLCGEIIL